MVNKALSSESAPVQELSTKAGILAMLRGQAGDFVSGNAMASALGISRVAVWKAAGILRDCGYPITRDDRGYRLEPEGGGDFLYPWEFGEREGRFHHWEHTDSTMNRARELADQGNPGGTVITAETQTAGKGRNGRSWDSGRGGLFFSLLERPPVAVADYTLEVVGVHIVLGRALSGLCGVEARLRWPNDVYIRGKKAAGILTEVYGEGDRLRWMIAGVGVNVNNAAPLRDSVSCAAILGHSLSRRAVLETILRAWAGRRETNPRRLSRLWNREAEGIGQSVSVITPSGDDQGIFLGIDASGRGMVKTLSGVRRLTPGSASLRF